MSPDARPEIAVVVPTYRRADGAARLVDALEAQTLDADRFEVVFVDDCSPGDHVERLGDRLARSRLHTRLLQTPRNGGPAAARNLGWRATDARVIAFVDDDCRPAPGWLEAGLAAFAGHDRLGVVQGRTDRPPDSTLGDWTVFREVHGETPYFEGTNIFFRRDALAEVGGFDEELRFYFEDTAAGWAVVDAGWARGYADGAAVEHDTEERGLGWHVRNGWTEANVVPVALRHPGFRAAAFFRPWTFRRENAGVAIAWVGLLAGLRWRPALALVLPWLWWHRPPRGHHRALALWGERFIVDSAQTAGHLRGSLRERTLIL